MTFLLSWLVLTGAHADPRVGRALAVRDIIWTHLTGRYPKLPLLTIRAGADGEVVINGVVVTLEAPRPAFTNLPNVRLIGTAGERARPWMLFQTRDPEATLIWARYDRHLRRLKFAGTDRVLTDPKAFLITHAYLEAAMDEIPAEEFQNLSLD